MKLVARAKAIRQKREEGDDQLDAIVAVEEAVTFAIKSGMFLQDEDGVMVADLNFFDSASWKDIVAAIQTAESILLKKHDSLEKKAAAKSVYTGLDEHKERLWKEVKASFISAYSEIATSVVTRVLELLEDTKRSQEIDLAVSSLPDSIEELEQQMLPVVEGWWGILDDVIPRRMEIKQRWSRILAHGKLVWQVIKEVLAVKFPDLNVFQRQDITAEAAVKLLQQDIAASIAELISCEKTRQTFADQVQPFIAAALDARAGPMFNQLTRIVDQVIGGGTISGSVVSDFKGRLPDLIASRAYLAFLDACGQRQCQRNLPTVVKADEVLSELSGCGAKYGLTEELVIAMRKCVQGASDQLRESCNAAMQALGEECNTMLHVTEEHYLKLSWDSEVKFLRDFKRKRDACQKQLAQVQAATAYL